MARIRTPQSLERDYNVKPVPFNQVQVRDGFWTPRLEINRTVIIPYCFEECKETGRIRNFERVPGRFEMYTSLRWLIARTYRGKMKVIDWAARRRSPRPLLALLDEIYERLASFPCYQLSSDSLRPVPELRNRNYWEFLRGHALHALGQHPSPEAWKAVVEALNHNERHKEAVYAIQESGRMEAAGLILGWLNENGWYGGDVEVRALKQLGWEARSPEEIVCHAVQCGLKNNTEQVLKLGKEAAKPLRDAYYREHNEELQTFILAALVRCGDRESAVALLQDFLDRKNMYHPAWADIERAARELGRLDRTRASEALGRIAKRVCDDCGDAYPEEWRQQSIEKTLAMVGEYGGEQAVPVLLELFDSKPVARKGAALALGRIGGETVVNALVDRMPGEDAAVLGLHEAGWKPRSIGELVWLLTTSSMAYDFPIFDGLGYSPWPPHLLLDCIRSKGDSVIEPLIVALTNDRTCEMADFFLGGLGSPYASTRPKVVRSLLDNLDTVDIRKTRAIVEVLGHLAAEEAIPRLLALLARWEESKPVVDSILHALHEIWNGPPGWADGCKERESQIMLGLQQQGLERLWAGSAESKYLRGHHGWHHLGQGIMD
jgi:HEAT repeat protein